MGFESTGYARDLFARYIPKFLKEVEKANELKQEALQVRKEEVKTLKEISSKLNDINDTLRWLR